MPTQQWENCALVAEVRWRRLALRCLVHVTRASLGKSVLDSWQQTSSESSGGPGTLPRRDDGMPNPPPLNDWTAQVQALAANPGWAQEQFAQWKLLHQQYQHLQYQQQLVATSTTGILGKCFPRTTDALGDRWSMDTGTDRIGV